jgi:hypothetical protein
VVAEGLAHQFVMKREDIYVKVANYWKITNSNGYIARAQLHASVPGCFS